MKSNIWKSFSRRIRGYFKRKILSNIKFVIIGNHIENHLSLKDINDFEYMKSEIKNANVILEEKIYKKVKHFSYPYGSKNEIGQREVNYIKDNFESAVTIRRGNIFLEHKQYLWCLPRVQLISNFKLTNLTKFRLKRIVHL